MLKAWKIRDGDGGRAAGAFQFERLAVKVTRWRVILAGLGVAAYALGLVAMLPAEVVAPGDREAVGTVWDGQMALDGGFAAGWRTQPLASLAHLSLAERLRVTGPLTELNGQVLVRPGRVLLRDLDGTASARLISALAPGLPFACDADLRVAIEELALQGAPAGAGTVRSSPGDCTPAGGGTPSPLPALTGTFSADAAATTLILSRAGSDATAASARVTPAGKVNLTIEPAGVGLFPGVNTPVSLETTL